MRSAPAILLLLAACSLVVRGYDRPSALRYPALRKRATSALLAADSNEAAHLALVPASRRAAPACSGRSVQDEVFEGRGQGFGVPELRLSLRGGARKIYDYAEDDEDEYESVSEEERDEEEVRPP